MKYLKGGNLSIFDGHTEGEWNCNCTSHHSHDYRLSRSDCLIRGFNPGEGRVNARLIEAAPILLEELREARETIERLKGK